jgi:hypothetical protein
LTDWVTIYQVATAGGTLVLAIATFSSIRASNRSARIAEQALLAGQRPVLIPSRLDDPSERVRFGDGHVMEVAGHGGLLELVDQRIYMSLALRNGGSGLAVLLGWHVEVREQGLSSTSSHPPIEDFRRQARDLYIPAQQTGFWQGAIREADDPSYESIRNAALSGDRINVDLLYGDYQGGQRSIARFGIASDKHPDFQELEHIRADVLRYWNVDGDDPR